MQRFFLELFFKEHKNKTSDKPAVNDGKELPSLPDELWVYILSYLSWQTLISIAKTCKNLNTISVTQQLWLAQIKYYLTSSPPENISNKRYFAEHYPLLRALSCNSSRQKFEKALGESTVSSVCQLDILFSAYLKKYFDKHRESEQGFEEISKYFPVVATNQKLLKVLIDFLGQQNLREKIKSKFLKGRIEKALTIAFEARNQECLRMLLDLGVGSKSKKSFEGLTVNLLSYAILNGDKDLSNLFIEKCSDAILLHTLRELMRIDIPAHKAESKFGSIIVNNKIRVDQGLAEILKKRISLLQHITKFVYKMNALDMSSLISVVLEHEKQTRPDAFHAKLCGVALEALRRDSIEVFRAVLNFKDLKDIFTKNIFHCYIDIILQLSNHPHRSDNEKERIYSVLPIFYDQTSPFTTLTPRNCIKFIDLFAKLGADINTTNAQNETVLEAAVKTGCPSLIIALLKNGATITANALQKSKTFPTINAMLAWGNSLQQKVSITTSVSNNNNNSANANVLTTHGLFKQYNHPKCEPKEELRQCYVDFYTCLPPQM